MKSYHLLLAAVSAVVLSSCVEPVVVSGGGPSGYRRPQAGYVDRGPSRYDRSPSRYDRDHDHGRDRGPSRYDRDHDRRPGGSYSSDPRSPYSPGGRVVLPSEARRVSYRGQTYYNHRNVWYRPSGSTYVIVRSPY